jgi:hypothetical protein
MTLMREIKDKIISKELDPIFCPADLKAVCIDDPNNNLSNYDKRNHGAKNTKVLVSREISGVRYYTFDEQVFE